MGSPSIENRFDTNTISRYSYNNDAGGRRVSVIQAGTAFEPVGAMFNLYRYNSRSELTSAERYFGSSTNDTTNPIGLQDWSYAFDNIGNRTGTMKANASADYTANSLNQYTERTVHGSSDIIGSAEQNVTIEVNGNEADRQGYYWSHRLTVDNLFNPIYTQVVVEAVFDPGTNTPCIVSSETGNVFVAASPEEFTYDDDGNLLSDGRFEYQWDCENRLVAATTKDGLPEDMPIVHVEFEYDYMSRRVGKSVYEWDDGITNWVQADVRSFLYDGWSLIREEVSGATATTNWYIHGLDLSGSLQGAGGIGGLLAAQLDANSVVYCYDANGNVSELLDFTNGTILAHYEYSPFGETIVATGELAHENKFRFSTKPAEDNTGLVLYEYRPYSPSLGRWLSRDPIGERGGVNLYGFVENESIRRTDPKGLAWSSDFTGVGLLLLYLSRLGNGIYSHEGVLTNIILNDFSLPASLVNGWPEVKLIQDRLTDKTVTDFCAAGKGSHKVSDRDSVCFSGRSMASFNISTLSVGGNITVSQSGLDKKCKTCLEYNASLNWRFFDEIDAKSMSELEGDFSSDYSTRDKLFILLEAAFDVFGDKLLSANFFIRSEWETTESGCCPK